MISQIPASADPRPDVNFWLRFPRVKFENLARIRRNLSDALAFRSTNDFVEFEFVRRFRVRGCQVTNIVSDIALPWRGSLPVLGTRRRRRPAKRFLDGPSDASGVRMRSD
jgi:hypothetical protein